MNDNKNTCHLINQMSNIIPPLVSSSPPPMVAGEPDELDEDEFGDFTAAADLSSFEGYPLPTTPQHSSLSNYLTSISTHNTFPTQTNFIISPASNFPLKKDPFTTDVSSCNGQDDHIKLTNTTEYNDSADNSENIFCDIKTDINVHKNETSFVNNKSIEKQDNNTTLTTNAVENVMSSVQNVDNSLNEQSKSNIHKDDKNDSEDHCDKQKDECIKDNSEFSKNELEIPQENIQIEMKDRNYFKEDSNDTIKDNNNACSSYDDIEISEFSTCNLENSKVQLENQLINSCMEIRENNHNKEEINNLVHAINNISTEVFEDDSREVLKENAVAVFNDCAMNVVEETKYYMEPEINSENLIEKNYDKFVDDCIEYSNNEENQVMKSPTSNNDDDEDDFGDFSDFKTAIETETIIVEEQKVDDTLKQTCENVVFQDDFGDFNDYSIIQEQFKNVEFTSNFELKVQNSEDIFKNIFTFEETKLPECETIDFVNNEVFKKVQDIGNTNALSYHWTNSESQKSLLKALNIDSRNILFGPRWNLSMPRFAANLGFTPLEPVKTDMSSNSSQTMTPQTEQTACEVPDAKFDWNSSGLVNPLDYSQSNTMLLDLEQLVPSLDITHVTLSQQNICDPLSLDLDSWDFWLQTQVEPVKLESVEEKITDINQQISNNQLGLDSVTNTPLDINIISDSESVNSLKFIESTPDAENDLKTEIDTNQSNEITTQNSDDDDFTSFQSSKQANNWAPNLVPMKLQLRETHISTSSNNNNVEHNPIYNLESFELESTVVTPDLPRKTIEIKETIEDDDFNDFQMSTPQIEKPVAPPVVPKLQPLEPLKPIILDNQTVNLPTKINWPEPGIVSDDIHEFDFNFKRVNIETQPKSEMKSKTKIQPDMEQNTSKDSSLNSVVKPKLQSSASEEDDWSEFICAQNPSSTESPKMNLPKVMTSQHFQNINSFSNLVTNAVSQLELSVPNLQNTQLSNTSVLPPTFMPNSSPIKTNPQPSTQQLAAQQIGFGYQPPYQIPLQTISTPFGGLPQTSLSTYNNHFSIGPTELPVQNTAQQTKPSGVASLFDGPFNPELKPFQPMTVQQSMFAEQINPESQYINPTGYQLNSVESTFLKMQQRQTEVTKESLNTNLQDDDDDWTEFVSSQPIPNGLNIQKQVSNNFTPNIIANPVHFEAFQSYQPGSSLHKNLNNKKQPGNVYETQTQQLKKSSVPSISALPDLDFIAPKSKFFLKK